MNVPGQWRQSTLGDEIELAYGRALPSQQRLPGPIPVFGSNGIVGYHEAAAVLGPGIIVGRKGSVGEVAFSPEPFWPIDTTYYVVRRKQNDWRFLFYLLRHLKLTKLNSHSAVPGLNREDAYSLEVAIPDLSEQRMLARTLELVASAVERESAALNNAAMLKNAAMQRLFTHGLRGEPRKESEVGLIPQSWNLIPFADARTELRYGTSVRCGLAGRYPVLRIPNIKAGRVLAQDLKYVDLDDDVAENYKLRNGDLIFIRTNGVVERLGACAVYEGTPPNALFASYLIRARLKTGSLLPKFAAYFIASDVGVSLIAGRATPAADGKFNLNTGTIDSIPIPVPSTVNEQHEVVEILDAIDRKIDLNLRKKAVLEALFRALLGGLMSGDICVSDLDLSRSRRSGQSFAEFQGAMEAAT